MGKPIYSTSQSFQDRLNLTLKGKKRRTGTRPRIKSNQTHGTK